MTIQPNYTVNTRANFTLGGGDLFGTTAMIGISSWGEPSLVKEFGSFTELKDYYKTGQIIDAAQLFFNAGGRVLQTVRVAGTDKAKALLDLTGITLNAKYEGTFGNAISVTVTENGANRDVIIKNGSIVEKYLDIATNQLITDAINASSILVIATKDNDVLIAAATETNLAGGLDGTTVTVTDYGTIISDNLVTKEWDYLTIPEQTDDAFHTSIAGYIDDRATNENKYSLYITGVDKFEVISTTIARIATTTSGRLVVSHTAYFDATTEEEKTDTANWLDATYTAAMVTGKLCSLPVNDSPTFKTMPMIGGKTLLENDYNEAERESLISNGFIVIDKTFTNIYGIYMGVTRVGSNTVWNFQLDSMRKVDFIKENVYNISKGYFGQPNDAITRKALKSSINAFFNDTIRDRIIESAEVEVLKGTDPREVLINVSVKLISEVDYITFNLTLNV